MGACGAKPGGMTPDQANAVGVVQKMFGMWGEGKFKSDQSEADFVKVMESINTPDSCWDFSGPQPEIYKSYTGAKAFKTWMAFLEGFDFPKMTPTFFPGPAGSGMAIMYMQYDMLHKDSKATVNGNTDVFVFTIKGDKIAACKQYWGKVPEINAAMNPALGNDPSTTSDQKAAMAAVMNMFGTWGAGKMRADQPDEEFNKNVGACWCADHIIDVRGPNSPFYKKYESGGKIDGTKDWIKFLDQHDFPNMNPKFFPGPAGSNKVYCDMSYDMKYKDRELLGCKDIMEFEVKDGKVYSLKQCFGDPVKITETFGDVWEMPA